MRHSAPNGAVESFYLSYKHVVSGTKQHKEQDE